MKVSEMIPGAWYRLNEELKYKGVLLSSGMHVRSSEPGLIDAVREPLEWQVWGVVIRPPEGLICEMKMIECSKPGRDRRKV